MADENENKELDIDAMSDEDFLKLSEEDVENAVNSQEEEAVIENNSEEEDPNAEPENAEQNEEEQDPELGENVDGTEPSADDSKSGDTGDDSVSDDEFQKEEEPTAENLAGDEGTDPNKTPETPDGAEGEKPSDGEDPEEKAKKPEVKPEGENKEKTPAEPDSAVAVDFFKKVTATFKADGKDFSVRTPEDAIRLMQQGVNYSRRMHELKPMKAMNRMLTDHGLSDPKQLSFAIDLMKGDKAAITKLLKDKNLDPMDLDTSKEIGYQAPNYAGNSQDNAFRDALDTAMTTPDGQALVSEIHTTWDETSKAQLRKNPHILGNLNELRQSGVYSKITTELDYQRTMGYLTDVPFLQAFDQVGEAMKNAGVLGPQPKPAEAATPLGQLQSNTPPQGKPVKSGARKAPGTKNPKPNPHLSSTPPSNQSNQQVDAEPNFDKMSDEDFLKMPPPE